MKTDGSVVGTRVSARRNNVQSGVHFVTNRSHWWPQMSCRGFRSVQVPTVGNPVKKDLALFAQLAVHEGVGIFKLRNVSCHL